MLSVRELIGDLDVTLLAGEAQLDAPVRWVHISELPDPTPWLSGGELLLTTGMALESRGRPARLRAAPGRPRARGPRRRDRIPPRAHPGRAGRGGGRAVVPALRGAVRDAVHRRHGEGVLAARERAVRRAAAFDRRAGAPAADRPVRARARRDRRRARRRSSAAPRWSSTAAARRWRSAPSAASSRPRRSRRWPPSCATARGAATAAASRRPRATSRGRALALPVGAERSVPQAWLVAAKDTGGLAEFDRLILHQAVTVIALELLRRHVAETTERRLAGDVLAEIVSGRLAGAELARRLEPFGLGGRVTALVLAPGERFLAACEEAVERGAARGGGQLAGRRRGPHTSARSCPACSTTSCSSSPGASRRRPRRRCATAVPAGAGRAAAAGEARRAFHEARCALEARAARRERQRAHQRRRDVPRPRVVPAAAVAAGLRRAAPVLRVAAGPDRERRGPLRRRADALARGVHRMQRAVGGRRAARCTATATRCATAFARSRSSRAATSSSARDRIEFWLALRGRELVTN